MSTVSRVAEAWCVPPSAITGKCRKRHLVEARTAAVVVMRDRFKLSFPRIGYFLNRDHSTIIHLYTHAPDRRRRNPDLDRVILALFEDKTLAAPALRTMSTRKSSKPAKAIIPTTPAILARAAEERNARARERARFRNLDDGDWTAQMVYRGSVALAAAIAREFPERMAA